MRMKRATVKHPFGIQRFEILFGLSNAIFLLFIGMNMLKESLEHLMLEDDHHGGNDRGGHQAAVRISVFWPLIGLGATLISALGYRNHSQFCQCCVVGVALVAMFPHVEGMDKLVAIVQSIVMFTLGGPLTKTLGMIILQTTPPGALESVEEAIRQLSAANPAILRIDRAHVWTNTYGQLIGTLILSVAKGSDEQALLAIIHQRLQTFLDLDAKAEGTGELTVKLVQH
ncbi:Endoplasmic reticulum zinc transporter [Mortierella sp. GBA43]|nr:Endoplasmic reticulum zinc transporter [Mortierella sp. GBA43]